MVKYFIKLCSFIGFIGLSFEYMNAVKHVLLIWFYLESKTMFITILLSLKVIYFKFYWQ